MKKLISVGMIAVALSSAADTRLPEYGQVAGVSNQVMELSVPVNNISEDVDVIRNLMSGGELNSPNMAGLRIIFNAGQYAVVPPGEEYWKALNGAAVVVNGRNMTYRFEVTNLKTGAVQRVYIPCVKTEDVTVSLSLGQANHVYSTAPKIVHVVSSQMTDVYLDTLAPMDPTRATSPVYRMIGRAQYYDPTNAKGKRNVGDSFPVIREWDEDTSRWVTYFGDECRSSGKIYNQIPQLGSDGAVSNPVEVGNLEHAYETQAFPWNETKPVAVVVSGMTDTTGKATQATNVFFFSRMPIYVFKETIENFTVSGVSYPMQVRWVARPEITNGYDNAFYIPSWEKVYKRVQSGDIWETVCIGVKEANYYACYKCAPTSAKNANWYFGSSSQITLQSYPWPNRDGSNYGVVGISRGDMHTRASYLNAYSIAIHDVVNGTEVGPVLRSYPAPTGDMATRRWAGNNWNDYQAFRELCYIQFGANAQNTTDGIIGNNTTSVLETRQDELEFYWAQQTNLVTFTIAPRTANGYPFSWLRILNFWGSEGDQMADVTGIAQSDSDGTKSFWWAACVDRSRWIPNTSGTATDCSVFFNNGYEKLSYYAAYTGKSGTFYRGKDQNATYSGFHLVSTTPEDSYDLFAVNLSSSAYDANWLGGYPSVPASGSMYNYYMASLSSNRGDAIGPWYVFAAYAPSYANAIAWGGRASINLLLAEGEARSE